MRIARDAHAVAEGKCSLAGIAHAKITLQAAEDKVRHTERGQLCVQIGILKRAGRVFFDHKLTGTRRELLVEFPVWRALLEGFALAFRVLDENDRRVGVSRGVDEHARVSDKVFGAINGWAEDAIEGGLLNVDYEKGG